MSNRNEDRCGLIKSVLSLGRRLDEPELQAQALVALGDECADPSVGEPGWSLDYYQQALELLDGSEVPILAFMARRKLVRCQSAM